MVWLQLPDSWITSTLGSQLIRSDERIDPLTKPDERFFYVGLEHIESNTGNLLDVPLVSGKEIKSLKTLFRPGDILFGKLRPNLNKVHVAEEEGICSTDIWVLKAAPTIDREYAAHYLRSPAVVQRMSQWAIGANLPRVNAAVFDSTPIPLPTLPEQHRIASILRQADELRRVRNKALDTVSELTSSIFNEILGNARNSKGWPIEPLRRLIIDTPQNGLYKHSSSYGEGTPIVRITDFYEGRLNAPNTFNRLKATQEELDKYGLENGNVLINRVNSEEFLGKCALVEGLTEPTLFESNMMRLIVDREKVTSRYLSYFLNTNHARKQILKVAKRAVNQASINQQDVMNLRIPIPSWEAMEKFETMILAAYEIEQITTDSLKSINDLFKSILAQAFTGELTARWRRQHEAELLEAARTRDALLSKSLTEGVRATTLTPEATVTHPAPPEREELVAFLGRKQQRVLNLANVMIGYFTPQDLYDSSNALSRLPLSTQLEANALSHADLRQGLQLLAALGLVMRVRVGTEPTKNELIFTPAYRRLLPSQDDSRLRDLDRLGANGR